jgi:hypothetical protein
MEHIAVVILADAESHADMGRVANALELAKEAQEQGDAVKVIFDGAGTRWVPALTDENGQLNPLYRAVEKSVAGACSFCASAFHVADQIAETDVPLLEEYDKHPSLRSLIAQGYNVVTF